MKNVYRAKILKVKKMNVKNVMKGIIFQRMEKIQINA